MLPAGADQLVVRSEKHFLVLHLHILLETASTAYAGLGMLDLRLGLFLEAADRAVEAWWMVDLGVATLEAGE